MVFDPIFVAVAVIVLNAVPAFMPPTWVFLTYIHLTRGGDLLSLVLIGAVCSTIGRIILAKWSGPLVSAFMSKPMHSNAEFAKKELSHKPFSSFIFTFLYALSPFPSNAIFILAGTAGLRLIPIVAGFFLGRLISYYSLLVAAGFTAGAIGPQLSLEGNYRWLLDILGIAATLVFFLVDWKKILDTFRKKKSRK